MLSLGLDAINGKKCPRCSGSVLYIIEHGKRYKCGMCKLRYSMDKLRKDIYFLVWFIKGKPAHGIQKELGFKKYSYNSIYNRFMALRKEIAEYCDLNKIPKDADYARLGPRALSDYREFEARRLSKYSVLKSWNYDLYIREIEFLYHFRLLKPRDLVDKLMEIHFAKRFNTTKSIKP